MNWIGWIGVGLIGLALALALTGVLLTLPAYLRFRRRLAALRAAWRQEAAPVLLELARAERLGLERSFLLAPFAPVRRWLRHPLVGLLVESRGARLP